MTFRNILFLGAHPDDEMGCAGTIARFVAEGAKVEALTLSTCAELVPAPFTGDDLVNEWTSALNLLGVGPRKMLDYPNRHLPEYRQDILAVFDRFRTEDYDLVLVPSSADVHQDHATIYAEAIRAFKRTTILGYELPFNHVRGSTMTSFVRLSPELVDLKVQHSAIYATQATKPYVSERHIRGLATIRGVQIGVDAAEAFEVIRWVI